MTVWRGFDYPAAEAQPRLGPRRAWMAVAALAAIALAVLAGTRIGGLVGSDGRQPAPTAETRHVDVGAARVFVPADWRRAPLRSAGIDGLDPATTVVLTPYSGAPARAIVTTAAIDDPSLLPAPLRAAAAGSVTRPRTTWLAGRRAWVYSDLRTASGDRTIDVTVFPTTAGVVAIGCVSPIAWSSAGGECAASVETIGLRAAAPLVPSADLTVRERLPRVLATLDAVRVRARAGLNHAATAAAQARWALELARANRAAASSLGTVAGTPGAAVVHRLSSTARAYARLSVAARQASPTAFSSARREVDRAEASLAASVADLTASHPARPRLSRPARAVPATRSSAGPTHWLEIAALALLVAIVLAGVGIRALQGRARRSWYRV